MMKQKDIDNVEFADFKSMSKPRQTQTEYNDEKHSNPLANKFKKFVHTKLSKFKPEDLF